MIKSTQLAEEANANPTTPGEDPQKILIGAVGGEALMEGIMMRGPKGAAVAVRLPDGSIETQIKQTKLPSERFKPLGWPLIRGPVSFIYSMVFGYKCMMEAAEKTTMAELDGEESAGESSKLDQWLEAHMGEKMMGVIGLIGGVLGIALALGLFVYAPSKLTAWMAPGIPKFHALIAGGMRILIFVGYMFLMSQLKDIRRVFQYHGAEHKSIFCYESGLPLTVENVRKQSRLHPRCGTSFLFVMLLLSIVVKSVVNLIWPWLPTIVWAQVAITILQFPVIMAIGYEFIRFAGRHLKNPVVRAISMPGLLMQRITTKEPDDGIIEVGIEALKAALGMPYQAKIPGKESAAPPEDNPDAEAPEPEA